MPNMRYDPITPAVILAGLTQFTAARVAALGRQYDADYSDLNLLKPDGSVCLTLTWPRISRSAGSLPDPAGPPEYQAFVKEIDGFTSSPVFGKR
jgi:hypothetical protein